MTIRDECHSALLVACALLASATAGAAAPDREWYSVEVDAQRVGYAWRERVATARGSVFREQLHIEVTQLQRRSDIERRLDIERDASGALRSIATQAVTGIDANGWRAIPGPKSGVLALKSDGEAGTYAVALPVKTTLPDELGPALAPLWRDGARTMTLAYFDSLRASTVQLAAVRIADESPLVHVRTHIVGDAAARPQEVWFDASGRIVRRDLWQFGRPFTWRRCDAACDRAIDTPFDPIARMVVRSPFRIPPRAVAGPIRYLIARTDGVAPRLPATPEQAVTFDGARAVVTICDACGRNDGHSDDPARYTQPNAWVQSTHPAIVALARRSGGGNVPVATRMPRLVELVRERMTGHVDYLGYASALEAWRTRSGDCTEFALLLAALARAEGIPTRIVVGLAYADRFSGRKDVFSPHSWVQAWDGTRWRSYDAALEDFDATHIAIAIGDGTPRQFEDAYEQLAVWKIEKAGLLRPAS